MNSNIKVKRAVAVVTLVAIVTAFCLPIFASTPAVSSYKTTTRSVSPITFKVSALQMDAQDGITNGSAYDYEIYIGASVTNSISTACYVDDLSFTLNFGDSSSTALFTLVDMETYSTDLELSCVNHTFGLVPSNEFSWSNGIVVPAHSSLYLVAKVRVRWTGPSSSTNNLNSITAYNFTTTTSDVYVPGIPVDFSPIVNYLETIPTQTQINNILTVMSQLYLRNHEDIQALIDMVEYEGNVPSYISTNGTRSYVSNTFATGYSIEIDRTIGTSYIVTDDFETDSSNDTYYQIGTKRTPVFVLIIVRNTSGQTIQTHSTNIVNGIFPNTNYLFNLNEFYSDLYTGMSLYSSSRITLQNNRYSTNVYNGIIPVGSSYTYIYGYIDTPIDVTLTFPVLDSNTYADFNNGRTPYFFDGYYPKNEYFILKDIYNSIQSSNQSSISSDSGTLKTDSDSAHTQEQSYFAQNSQAIQATGLSNYRFDTVQQNGINAVSVDFTQLWNALGAWNSVYIFSLTLTLSLTILRHAPNAISRRQRRKQE